MDYFNEALKRDPSDIRTNTAVGNIHLKNGEYEKARSYFATAIKRLTKDYTRPSNCEALYLQGLTLKALELYEEAIDTLYRATWDYAWHSAATLELAKISCLKGNFQKALEQVEQSLSTNTLSNSAINLKASILRKLGELESARATLKPLTENDPLDFRAGNEQVLIAQSSDNTQVANELLTTLTRKMRDFEQNYLALAIGYMNDGFFEEAEDVLRRFKVKNPEVCYVLGFLQDKKGNKPEAGKLFREASEMPVDYIFPFRLEMVKALNLASKYYPADAKPHYYLGNLLYDKQPEKAIACWGKAVEQEPGLATAWRNIGWGYYQHFNDVKKAINAYEKAFAIIKNEPVYYAELDPLYELNNTPIETRAKLFESANDVVKKRDDAFVRQIIVLNLAGKPDKAVEYLSGSNFHFREGSSRVRDITVDAHLLFGKKLMEEKKFEKELEQFLASVETPENAKRKTDDERSPQINYFIGLAYEAMGNKEKAKSHFTLSTGQEIRRIDFIAYYQGLSFLKLGNKTKANEIFTALIEEGNKRIEKGSEVDFFAKFGEKEAANVQLSNAWLLKGLGNKGLGNLAEATENLKKAVEFSASNLWAGIEIKGL